MDNENTEQAQKAQEPGGETSATEKSQSASTAKGETVSKETQPEPRLYKEEEIESIVQERANKLAQSLKDKELARITQERQAEEARKQEAAESWKKNHLTQEEEQAAAKDEKEVLEAAGIDAPTPALQRMFERNRQQMLLMRTGQGAYAELLKDRASQKASFREMAALTHAIALGLPEEAQGVLGTVSPLQKAIIEAVDAREKKYGRDLTEDEISDIAKATFFDFTRKPKPPEKTASRPAGKPDNNMPTGGGTSSLENLTPQERIKRRDELIRQGKK